MPLDVVEAYARIFFDVRAKLRATDWVSLRVLNGGVAASFRGDRAACVRYAGYSGGAAVAAVVWAVLADRPIPEWVPDRKQYDSPLAREKVRITVALMTATTPEQSAEAVRRMRALRRSKSTGERVVNDKGTSSMLDLQEEFLVSFCRPKSASPQDESILPTVISQNGPVVQSPSPRDKLMKGRGNHPSRKEGDTDTSVRVVPAPNLPKVAKRKGKTGASSDSGPAQIARNVTESVVDQSADLAAPNSAGKLLDHVGRKSPKKQPTDAERVRISVVL